MIRTLIEYLNQTITSSLYPTLRALFRGQTDSIVEAIRSNEPKETVSVGNAQEISTPIVEAIKGLEKEERTSFSVDNFPEIPVIVFDSILSKLDELKSSIESSEKNITVEAGKTEVNVDTKSIVDAISSLHSQVSLLSEKDSDKEEVSPIDYSAAFSSIQKTIESFPEYSSDLINIQKWLKLIAEKESETFSFPMSKDGRILVEVDRVGGGGGGGGFSNLHNSSAEVINPATEEKQDPTAPYSISDIDESGATKYYGYLKSDGGWYIMSVTSTAVRYVKGDSGYSFASPSSLTYDTFANTF